MIIRFKPHVIFPLQILTAVVVRVVGVVGCCDVSRFRIVNTDKIAGVALPYDFCTASISVQNVHLFHAPKILFFVCICKRFVCFRLQFFQLYLQPINCFFAFLALWWAVFVLLSLIIPLPHPNKIGQGVTKDAKDKVDMLDSVFGGHTHCVYM